MQVELTPEELARLISDTQGDLDDADVEDGGAGPEDADIDAEDEYGGELAASAAGNPRQLGADMQADDAAPAA